MIKRGPQEIADFFGCYVAQDEDGGWYMYKDKPMRNEDRGIWVGSIDDPLRIPYMTVEIPDNHFWTILYEPQPYSEKSADSNNKEASCSEKAPVSENKPDHTSEIYTEKEFKLIPAFDPARLEAMISDYLNDGFTLYGNPFVVEDRKYGPMIIQAIARGV